MESLDEQSDWQADIPSITEAGIQPFLDRHTTDGPERLRHAYDASWRIIYQATMADEITQFSDPMERISHTFARIWELDQDPQTKGYLFFAMICFWSRGEDNQVPFVFDANNSYFETEFIRNLESCCREIGPPVKAESPEQLAQFLLNYASTVVLTWHILPTASSDLTPAEAHLGLMDILRGDQPHPLS